MPILSPLERRAISKGKREGALENASEFVLAAVETRFGQAPEAVQGAINKIEDAVRLEALHRMAMTVGTLEEFEREPTL